MSAWNCDSISLGRLKESWVTRVTVPDGLAVELDDELDEDETPEQAARARPATAVAEPASTARRLMVVDTCSS